MNSLKATGHAAIQTSARKGGALASAPARTGADRSRLPETGASIPSRLKRSAIQARALLATGSSTRSHRRAAFVFMLERGRRFRRQRSEQYRTSSHAAFHFFLQLKGKPQVSHVFSGKCILLTMANHASRRILANCPVEQRCRRRYVDTSDHRRSPSNQRASSPSN